MKKNNILSKMIAVMIAVMMLFQGSLLGTQAVFAADSDETAAVSEQIAEEAPEQAAQEQEETKAEKAEEKESKAEEGAVEETASPVQEDKEQAPVEQEAAPQVEEQSAAEEAAPVVTAAEEKEEAVEKNEPAAEAEAEEEAEEEEEAPVRSIRVEYALNTPSNAVFVPEIVGLDGKTETLSTAKGQKGYSVRGLSRNLYQTQSSPTSGKISYEFMGWKTESGAIVSSADVIDLMSGGKTYDKNNDGVVKLTATWNNTFKYNGDGKYRYTTFSLYKTGKTPTAVDNTAGNYVSGMAGTIAYPGDITEPLMKNWKRNDEGRVIVNQDSNGIGLDECDSMIRGMTETGVSTYFDPRNGNEAAGYTEYEITFMDFPTDEEVIINLKARIETGLKITVRSEESVKTVSKTENYEDFDADRYEVKWFSVKYQNNGIHVDGIVVPKVIKVIAEEEVEEMDEIVEEVVEEKEEEAIEEKAAENVEEPAAVEVVVEQQAEETKEEIVEEGIVEEVIAEEKAAEEITTEIVEIEEAEEVSEIAAVAIVEAAGAENNDVTADKVTVSGNKSSRKAQAPANNSVETTTVTPAKKAAQQTVIEDKQAPLAAAQNEGTWAIFNLILAVLTAIGAIAAIRKAKRSLVAIPAVAAAILFILTEDMAAKAVLMDKWTVLMGIVLMIQAIAMMMAKREEENC